MKIAIGLAGVLATSASLQTVLFFAGVSLVPRFQVESAWLLFAVFGGGLRLIRSRDSLEPATESMPIWPIGLWIAAAFALYWPALGIGFLSDDFGLFERAARGDVSAFSGEAFRPVPLVMWSMFARLGGGPATVHAANIALHGVNAWLSSIIAQRYCARPWAIAAGILMLTLPIDPEVVAWGSGVFDVVATCLMLTCIVVARGYGADASAGRQAGRQAGRRVALLGLLTLAVLSKETALMAPLILLADAWGRGALRRPLLADLAIATALCGAYGALRLAFASATLREPVTRYVLQRALFGTFASLGAPWHADVIAEHRWIPVLSALVISVVVAGFLLRTRPTAFRSRVALVGMAFILVPILPSVSFLVAAPNLEGARHVYSASVGWAILLVALAAGEGGTHWFENRAGFVAVTVVSILGVAGVRLHLQNWEAAARLRDRVESAAASNPAMRNCQSLTLHSLPDNVGGAYVFRNGAPEAFKRDLGVRVLAASQAPAVGLCAFQWRGSDFVATNP